MSQPGTTDVAAVPGGPRPHGALEGAATLFDSVGDGSLDEGLVSSLASQFTGSAASDAGITVLRDLLRIETRRPRFQRLLRVWVGKLTTAVRAGQLDRAEAWLRGMVVAPTYPAEFGDLVEEAFDEVSQPEVLDGLVSRLAAAETPGTGAGLVAAWGERMARYLVQGIIVDEPPVNRRYLTEYLSWVGREDVRILAALVADPHWFVVRNVAIALGHTGRPQAVPALESLLDYPDFRVRLEAIRGLAALKGEEAVPLLVEAMFDPEPRVRNAAVTLLRASPSPGTTAALADLLETRPPAAAEARRLVEVMAERTDPGGLADLQRLAGKRRGIGVARVVRDTARELLERKSR